VHRAELIASWGFPESLDANWGFPEYVGDVGPEITLGTQNVMDL